MSKDKGKVKGGEKLHKRFEKIKRDALKELKFSIGRSVLLVQSTAVQSIQAGGTGDVVVRYNPRRTHSASAPGDPPATDTGHLVANISTRVKADGDDVVGEVISSAAYSKALEYGYAPNNLEPRPFMRPALMENKQKIESIIRSGDFVR